MNLRQWADVLAECMIEWDHVPIPLGEGAWEQREKVRHTYLEHICGARIDIHTEPESVICPGCPECEKDVLETGRLIFTSSWPRDDGYGYAAPNRYADKHNYRATCSANRTPQSVIDNIRERFIRVYLRKWYELERAMVEALEKKAKTLALVNELCALVDKDPFPDDWFTQNRSSASVAFLKISEYGSIHLTRRYTDDITPDFARKMLLLWSGKADIVIPQTPDLFAALESREEN